ncbi:type III secretion system export apparatus subunit SctT [Citrobacter sp. ANG330]|uniref:type III secretion system export apparatus subunit SctT n=1 Tax=Citrobacter sp. ANG330 TaxID=3048142 RepID=UPI0039C1C0F0
MNELLWNIEKTGPLLMIACLRPLGVFFIMPLLTSKNIGGSMIRNTIAILIIIPVFPAIREYGLFSQAHVFNFDFLLSLITEVVIGVLIGFVAAIPFWAIDAAGFLIDTMRGSSMGSIYNPTLAESSTLLGVFFSQLLTVLFFAGGGMNVLITTLYQSFVLFPPGKHIVINRHLLDFIIQQWNLLFTLFLRFSLPAAAVMLLTDVGMGLLNRSAQQLNVFFLAMSVKSILALIILMLTLFVLLGHFHGVLLHNLPTINQLWGRVS